MTTSSHRLGRYRKIEVVPTEFRGHGQYGDFNHMIRLKEYENTIFLFNDNFLQWAQALQFPQIQQGSGGGNAAIRPYEVEGKSMGIPTGPFPSLKDIYEIRGQTFTVAQIIEMAFDRILRHCLKNDHIKTIFYSAAPGSDVIGLGIFSGVVGQDVIKRITETLRNLQEMFRKRRLHYVDYCNV